MYYFVTKEKNVDVEDAASYLVYCFVAGVGDCWLDTSVTNECVFRYDDVYEARRVAARIGGSVASLSKDIYEWLVEQHKLDNESFGGVV